MASRSYRDLLVWQKGIDLVETTYSLTKSFPKQETYGLANQLQRCAVSVPSNIAEGQGRSTNKEFRRFLYLAVGSLAELDTQIEIAKRLSYIEDGEHKEIAETASELRRMLFGLINSIPKE